MPNFLQSFTYTSWVYGVLQESPTLDSSCCAGLLHALRIRAGGSALARVTRSCLCWMLLCDWLVTIVIVPNRVKFTSLPYCSGVDL